jgi:hypothetical protein
MEKIKMDKNQRHNRPKKKEKPMKTWENEFKNLRDTYGFSKQN